ncbi:MAG TPA: DUF6152 family protein [Gammaproteobacteria bacterium]|nr:DUF6152 family protein [Gammaproteobacteria bacterium]
MRSSFSSACKLALTVLALAPLAADAHHSFLGRFDRKSLDEIEGEVTETLWRNPHAYILLRVERDGAVESWEVETSSLSVLRRQGIEDGMIKVGDHIKVAGYPPVGAKKEMYARHVLLPDGRELLMDTGLTPRWSRQTVGEHSILSITEGDSSRPDLGIFRIWSFVRNGPRLFPEDVDPAFDVQSYPMTDSARAALAAFDRVAENPTGRCMPKGMPTVMEQPYPIEFVKRADGNIVLRLEEYDTERFIYMTAAAAPQAPEALPLGVSIGTWDGRTLVVTTTRVSWPYFSQVGIPQSAAVKLVERFAPAADGSRLDYELTVIDPATFTMPVVRKTYWIWVPQVRLLPYHCTAR